MEKEIVNQVQESQRMSYRLNTRRNMPRHILMKLTKTKHKERILKAARKMQGKLHMLNSWSFSRISAGQKEWQDIFKVLKGKNLQPRSLYLARISFRIDGKIKNFTDKKKLRELRTTKSALQQMLKGLIQSRNTKEEKKIYKINPKQLRKWQ